MSAPVSSAAPAEGSGSPRSYPLILRTVGYAPWKPIVGVLAAALGLLIVAPFALLPVLAAAVAIDHHGSFSAAYDSALRLDTVNWPAMLYVNLTLASLTLITWIVVRLVHHLPHRWLTSVLPGFRWRFFWACFGLAVIALAAQLTVAALMPGDPGGLRGPVNHFTAGTAGLAVVIALTTPLQAIGEEYGFRGYLLQALGSLSKHPWIGVVGSAFLFACAHGVQNAPLFADRFAFGLMAGYIVLRTGGLEAGIAMHVWNNLVAFGLALAIGNVGDSLKVTSVPWSNIVLTVTQNGVYLVLVLWMARRMGVRSTTTAMPGLPGPPPGAAPVLLPTTPPV